MIAPSSEPSGMAILCGKLSSTFVALGGNIVPELEARPTIGAMKEITPQDLSALGTDITLIDVREPNEVAEVRVPFAKSIPLSELTDRVDEIPDGAYIMCHAGGRSARTVQHLERLGKETTNVLGGISEWEAAGLPVERG